MDPENRSQRMTHPCRTRCDSRGLCAAANFLSVLAMGIAGCDRSVTSAPTPNLDGAAMVDRGLQFLEDGNNEKAIAAFTESIRLRPDDADAHYNRGLAYVRLGNFKSAQTDYSEAIKLRPDFSDAYTNRSVTFAHQGKLDEAIADCTKAIQLRPNNALAFRNRGLSYHEQGKYDPALADFNEALRLDAGLAEAYFNRANTYLKLQRTDLAAADFAEAYRLDSTLDVPEEYRKRPATAQGPIAPPALVEAIRPQSAPAPGPPAAKSDGQAPFELVADIYKAEGFTVDRAPDSEEGEMICRKAEQSVRVKIKTIAHPGDPVRLGKIELEQLAGQSTRADLVILCAQFDETNAATSNSAPRLRISKRIVDWKPRAEELKPVEFEYLPEK